MTDRLRDSLRDLADIAEPADLYDGAVRRSRRIARREATVGTAAALAALALLASGLWRLPAREAKEPPLALRSSAPASLVPLPRPTVTVPRHSPAPTHHATKPPTVAMRHKNQPQVAEYTATPASRTLADLPGHVFYQQTGADPDVVRMSPGDGAVDTVLPKAPSAVGVSPDGNKIAYAIGDTLLIEPTGGTPEQVANGVSTAGQPPAWSPDGDRLLVAAGTPAILQVGSGTLTPLGEQLAGGQHFRWSGDGTTLVYATSYCSLKVVAGDSDTAVPVIGDRQTADNPDGLAACKPTSVDATGQRVTVPLQTTGETGADSPDTADAVVDTVTGDVVPLPVTGSVVGAYFNPDGNLLVRSRKGTRTTLWLFAPDGTLLVQAKEPAELHNLNLLAYTR
ncbi:TolB family protein [Actinoplanes sp. CA-142083]|uniref:TolB family protein n=1 Tax=Actinoplanes sp. CA-142083 TaxID=3239903 RepID=UPI003D928E2D